MQHLLAHSLPSAAAFSQQVSFLAGFGSAPKAGPVIRNATTRAAAIQWILFISWLS